MRGMKRLEISRRELIAGTLGSPLLIVPFACSGSAARQSDPRAFESFLGAGHGPRDDCSRALVAAANWSAHNDAVVTFSGRYRIVDCPTIMSSAIFHFDNAEFDVSEQGGLGIIANGARGRIGMLFQCAEDVRLSGSLRLRGDGNAGSSRLAGLVFDHCQRARVSASIHYENMAAGCIVMWCDDGHFGDMHALGMNGRQTFGSGSAGSALIVIGCRRTNFGKVVSSRNYKPVLYCSVAKDRRGRTIDNESCTFGHVTGTSASGSLESSLIAVRSARDCTFAGAAGMGFVCGYNIARYSSDGGFSVEGNRLGPLRGMFPSTGASVDAAIVQEAESPSVAIGSNFITSVEAECSGEFGIAVFSGELLCGRIEISGATRPVVVGNATLRADEIVISNQGLEALTVGQAGRLYSTCVDIRSGSLGGSRTGIRYNPAFGSGGPMLVHVDNVRYRHNGAGTNLTYILYDPDHGQANWNVANVDHGGAIAGALLMGQMFNFRNGRTQILVQDN